MRPLVLLVASALAFSARAQESKPRVLLVPFAAATGEVPEKAAPKALGLLTTELKNAEAFVVLEAPPPPEAAGEPLAEARSAVEAAKDLRAKHKFRLADEALQRALAAYLASAASLNDVGELADTWALASAVAYTTGRDEEGQRDLAQALALAPDRELPLARTSPLFSSVVAATRQSVKASAQGSLTFETRPANAPVWLDGVAFGSAPLTIREVPLGQHLWSVRLPRGAQLGGLVEVLAGKPAVVRAQAPAKDPAERLLTPLALNRLDADLLGAAQELARASTADWVLFGALSRDGKGLALDCFVYAPASQELRRLARSQFDPELLSAGLQFYALATELTKQGLKAGEAVKVPAKVWAALPATRPLEVRYGVHAGKDVATDALETEAGKDVDGQRVPVPTRRRVPLKRPAP